MFITADFTRCTHVERANTPTHGLSLLNSLSALQAVLAIWANVLHFHEFVSKSYPYMYIT